MNYDSNERDLKDIGKKTVPVDYSQKSIEIFLSGDDYNTPKGKKKLKRERFKTYAITLTFFLIVAVSTVYFVFSDNKPNTGFDSTAASSENELDTSSEKPDDKAQSESDNTDSTPKINPILDRKHDIKTENGITLVDNILIVNKTYSLPNDYAPGLDAETQQAFNEMVSVAYQDNIILYVCSGYRSYQEQNWLYQTYVNERGTAESDKVSSRPGHSEHQSGLCIDVNNTDDSFEGTDEAKWLEKNCADYGFIIRYPKGKEDKTGYSYEPWHIRYVGKEVAKEITDNDLTLEEYLGVTSDYKYADDSGIIE